MFRLMWKKVSCIESKRQQTWRCATAAGSRLSWYSIRPAKETLVEEEEEDEDEEATEEKEEGEEGEKVEEKEEGDEEEETK